MLKPLTSVTLRTERDVVQARQVGRDVAASLGFDRQDQIRVATATSEMARNAFRYARNGKVEFQLDADVPQRLVIRVSDGGPGIPHLQDVFDGVYQSTTGMGKGIVGTRRLMDAFDISTSDTGTVVVMEKGVPVTTPVVTETSLARLQKQLQQLAPPSPFDEIETQNQELLKTLAELRSRQEELVLLNRELEDTNRGVVALYAELEERADFLRRVSDLKTTFLSNMSHEFRTPLNSVISLSRMLLEDDEAASLSPEQRKQVRFIAKSAQDLSEMVNDLLDIAKVEAGKVVIRPKAFAVLDLFSALRGMLKPLLADNTSLDLTFETPDETLPEFYTDEGKLSQILRNLISNAIKYTQQGEVRVSVTREDEIAVFAVTDTGLGIAKEDQERIFQEFVQLDNPLQAKSKGTGLGLPLCRKLATLLGGTLTVRSELGRGSTFTARIPIALSGHDLPAEDRVSMPQPHASIPILIVEDNKETAFLYDTYVRGTEFSLTHASNEYQARELLSEMRPAAVLMDLYLNETPSWELMRDSVQRGIPTVVASVTEEAKGATAIGAAAVLTKPVSPELFLETLRSLTRKQMPKRILLVDDNEVSRYVLRQHLSEFDAAVAEARDGREALQLANSLNPDLIFLDLLMPDMSGFEVMQQLKSGPATRHIPVVIHSSMTLDGREHAAIIRSAAAVLAKDARSYAADHAQVRNILTELGFATAFHSTVNG